MGHLALPSHECQLGAGSEVEQLRLEQVPKWDAVLPVLA